jgi:hypothetical protein
MFSKNFTDRKNFISDQSNLILVSGFLSALNSFSEEFEDLGSIKELKLSQSNFRLAFLKDNSIPNLIYLASFDEETNSVNVERFLKKMSNTFLKKYSINKIADWDGRSEIFESFTETVKDYIEKESDSNKQDSLDGVVSLFKEIQNGIEELPERDLKMKNFSQPSEKNVDSIFQRIFPISEIPEDFNPDFYLTGEVSKKVLKSIDGRKSINTLSKELSLKEDKIHNICKNLVKLGFLRLKEVQILTNSE